MVEAEPRYVERQCKAILSRNMRIEQWVQFTQADAGKVLVAIKYSKEVICIHRQSTIVKLHPFIFNEESF